MRLGGVLEASRRNLEASSRRLKHTLGRLKAARRCRPKNLSVSVSGLMVLWGGQFFFRIPLEKPNSDVAPGVRLKGKEKFCSKQRERSDEKNPTRREGRRILVQSWSNLGLNLV